MLRVLVVNDDGIAAPGLAALVTGLAPLAAVSVAAPHMERSASGHGITIAQNCALVATPVALQGSEAAFAVTGLPADCSMLALNSNLFTNSAFDVVCSGINRGNNLGLHVIYSGTVAGAREAALEGVLAVAVSLDHHSVDADYEAAATVTATLVRRLLARQSELQALRGSVLNVNVPRGALGALHGYVLTHQSYACQRPGFVEAPLPAGPHPHAVGPSRAWRNSSAGGFAEDNRKGGDAAAVAAGSVAVTVLTVLSHALPLDAHPVASCPPAELPPLLCGFSDAAADALLAHAAAAAAAVPGGLALSAAPAEASL